MEQFNSSDVQRMLFLAYFAECKEVQHRWWSIMGQVWAQGGDSSDWHPAPILEDCNFAQRGYEVVGYQSFKDWRAEMLRLADRYDSTFNM